MDLILYIHRGADEIGGNIVEVRSQDARLILDVGSRLDDPAHTYGTLPADRPLVPGLWRDGPTGPPIDAVIISHAHTDHCGLLSAIKPDIPVYASSGTHALLQFLAAFGAGTKLDQKQCRVFPDQGAVRLGDLELVAHPVDHSAFDSQALEILSGSKRLVYSGDLRAHGRTGARFTALSHRIAPGPDAMLLEGTCLGRVTANRGPRSEKAVEDTLRDLIHQWPGALLIAFSPLNLDRLVSVYKASRACGRCLLIDPYAAVLLQCLDEWPSLPKPGWTGLRVWFPRRITRWLNHLGMNERLRALRPLGVHYAQIKNNPDKYTFLFRPSLISDLPPYPADSAKLIYSMWAGYLQRPEWSEILDHSRIGSIQTVHCSGHASPEDLAWLCRNLKPKKVIPIHTTATTCFKNVYDNICELSNNMKLEI